MLKAMGADAPVAAVPDPRALLAPPLQQALGRLRAAREFYAQATSPRAVSVVARLDWAARADREVAAAESILRTAIPHPIL